MTATAPPPVRPAPPPDDPRDRESRLRERLRLGTIMIALATVAFAVAPGRILPDTKLDMPLNPGGFLARAMHMWDPSAYFGQVQNQAYGYLFPMGPFYLLGKLAGPAPWVTQRLWIALVLCTAFLGIVKLAEALRIGSPGGRLIAGVAYALAPRAQELVAVNSSEFLPAAVLPWVLLPLVRGSQAGSPRRAAALSALAVVCFGGINAAAEAAALAVPLIYLLTRAPGPRRRRLLGWWIPLTAAATIWWIVPTYLMGRYIFPFLGYTENATTTTKLTSLTNVLRGTPHWLGYLPSAGNPWWPAGHVLSTTPWLIAVTGIVAGLGLMGLCRSGLTERTFLVALLVLGVVIMAAAHPGVLASPLADPYRGLLDSVLAPFRNVHKFDALVRLPLVLGLAHLVAARAPHSSPGTPRWLPTLPALAIGAVALSLIPVLSPGMGTPGSMTKVPGYWRQATDWLDHHAGAASVLAVPGTRFGEFEWGRAMDDPMQPLLKVRWANRMLVPYGSAGTARLIEAIESRFADGRGSPGLAKVLSRMGVRFLLVRNDLDRGAVGSARPARIHEALAASPGLSRAAEFGGRVGSDQADAISAFDQRYRAVEVYEVARPRPVVSMAAGTRPLRVTGGPEALLTLADEGLLDDDRPVVFNDDTAGGAETVVTDTLRRREVNFSDLRNGASATMTADEAYTGTSRTKDVTAPGWDRYRSVARYTGIASVTASSSASEVSAPATDGSRARLPYAALDGDPRTQWMSAGWHGPVGEWLMVGFERPRPLDRIDVSFVVGPLAGPAISEVSVETEAGARRQAVRATDAVQHLSAPGGTSGWLRIRVVRAAGESRIGTRAGISELSIPGVTPGRAIATPPVPGAGTFVFTGAGAAAPCMRGSRAWACSPLLEMPGEDGRGFARVFTSGGSGRQRLSGSAVATDLDWIQRSTAGRYPRIKASSAYVEHPAAMGRSALDGDRATTWIAKAGDRQPRLSVRLGKTIQMSELRFSFPNTKGDAPALSVRVQGGNAVREGLIDQRGVLRFLPIKTDELTITFPGSPGVQITDLRIPGVRPLGPPPETPIRSRCGQGPAFTLGAQAVRTRLVGATAADLLLGRPVRYESCGRAPVTTTGEQRLELSRTGPYRISTAVLRPAGALSAATTAAGTAAGSATAGQWTATSRSVEVRSPAGGYLVLNENLNKGWTAELNGRRLAPVRLDGWRQGWVIPANAAGTINLGYGPDRSYRLALLAGLLLVLLVVAAALIPARRRASEPGPAGPWRLGRWALWSAALVTGFLVGGLAGLVIVPAAYALGAHLERRTWRAVSTAGVVAVLLTAAAITLATGMWLDLHGHGELAGPLTDAVPQLLCLVVLGALLGVARGRAGAAPDEKLKIVWLPG